MQQQQQQQGQRMRQSASAQHAPAVQLKLVCKQCNNMSSGRSNSFSSHGDKEGLCI
jgi:hypothetical protein